MLQGVTLTARAKLRNPVLHSLAASVNERAGTVLAVKCRCESKALSFKALSSKVCEDFGP